MTKKIHLFCVQIHIFVIVVSISF